MRGNINSDGALAEEHSCRGCCIVDDFHSMSRAPGFPLYRQIDGSGGGARQHPARGASSIITLLLPIERAGLLMRGGTNFLNLHSDSRCESSSYYIK